MSAKDCGGHGRKRQELCRRIFAGILIFLFLVLLTILLIWAILRPSKPSFVLQDVTVYAFNVSALNYLTSNFQITFSSRNPNDKIGIYYDKLDVYAIYRNQQITLRSAIPSTYQGHNEINVWSPNIYGTDIPVAPYNGWALSEDQSTGAVLLMIKMDGRVRFKVGTFISGRYHLYVRCPAYIQFGSSTTSITAGENSVKYSVVVGCSVSL
ncbi:NDR1/HIN1-like protein 1 [Manihot esculenta]|uniref:Late embryogenesis abundant protein LEA-2 subgroup domain-containing protein n=1 Tax=Manihot esculenta TaxID=3983 RepID=A0A2C9V9K9_MANES|nr:NDR1/HIN1-like protein 1 [Manihot esculenta]OAY40766.1 hypothetical protein MANES_09G046700v8 [Manihot esculenta]